MLKNKGIEFFPPIKDFKEAFNTFMECGGMLLSLEEEGFLVDEPKKICKLYCLKPEELSLYLSHTLIENGVGKDEVKELVEKWVVEEKISEIKL